MSQELSQDLIKKLIAEDYLTNYDKNASKLIDVIEAIDYMNNLHGNPFLEVGRKRFDARYQTGLKRDTVKMGTPGESGKVYNKKLDKEFLYGLFHDWAVEQTHAKQGGIQQPEEVRDSVWAEQDRQINKYGTWGRPKAKHPYEGTYAILNQEDSGQPTIEAQAHSIYEGLILNQFLDFLGQKGTKKKEGRLEDILEQLERGQFEGTGPSYTTGTSSVSSTGKIY